MARDYSVGYKSTLSAVTAPESPLILVEITHPDLDTPVRVVNDTVDIQTAGETYIACPFRCTMPDDFENQLPKAKLAIDNVSRDLMYWLEKSGGGEGSKARFMQVMRSAPDTIEWEQTLSLYNVQVTIQEVSADLGFDNLYTKPAIRIQYRQETAPGIF